MDRTACPTGRQRDSSSLLALRDDLVCNSEATIVEAGGAKLAADRSGRYLPRHRGVVGYIFGAGDSPQQWAQENSGVQTMIGISPGCVKNISKGTHEHETASIR